jgi:hypothetical protein
VEEEPEEMIGEYRTIYEPEELPPPAPPHTCRPVDYRGSNKPKYKDRTIIECIECGQFWWASVFTTGKGEYLDPKRYSIYWAKVRWYHFKLKKYTQ